MNPLNDYLTLGATVGIPAFACYLAYVALSLSLESRVWSQESEDWSPVRCPLSPTVYRAGAVAPAVVFWVLLEARRERRPRPGDWTRTSQERVRNAEEMHKTRAVIPS